MLIIKDVEAISGVDKVVVPRNEKISFVQGDNMAFLEWCYENEMYKYFHVGIVDPPYGIGVTSLNMGSRAADRTADWKEINRGTWDNEVPIPRYWFLMRYLCRELVVWGGNYFTEHFDWSGRCFITWDKMNDKMSFAAGELALTTFDQNAFIIRKPRNMQAQDGDKRHPTQKPVYLYDATYKELNIKKGQRILDTHGGSHSHAIAAWRYGVELTIIERFSRYHEDGLSAFIEQTTASRLF